MAIFIVDSVDDTVDPNDGVRTLREAILDANASAGPDTIAFDPSLSGDTIVLTSDLPIITESLNILGTNGPTIDANKNNVFQLDANNANLVIEDFEIFNVGDSTTSDAVSITGLSNTVSISGLTVTGRDGFDRGIGVDVEGGGGHHVTIMDSTFRGLTGDGSIDIDANNTTLTLIRSTIEDSVNNIVFNEAIEVDGSFVTLNIRESTFRNTDGIDQDGGTGVSINISGSEFFDHEEALRIEHNNAVVVVRDTLFQGNGGGITVVGDDVDLTVKNSMFLGNEDGIQVFGSSANLTAQICYSEFLGQSDDGIDDDGSNSDKRSSRLSE